jgi:hypothetical protein
MDIKFEFYNIDQQLFPNCVLKDKITAFYSFSFYISDVWSNDKIVNKVENVMENTYIFDLIDNLDYAVYTLWV